MGQEILWWAEEAEEDLEKCTVEIMGNFIPSASCSLPGVQTLAIVRWVQFIMKVFSQCWMILHEIGYINSVVKKLAICNTSTYLQQP